jgi:hypothetical protein
MLEYKIYKSRKKALKLLMISLVLVAMGFFILSRGKASVVYSWLMIGFFSLGILLALFQLFDRRPHIFLNEIGIFNRTASDQVINWEIIQDAYIVKMQQETFICLVVPEQFEPSQTQSLVKKRMAKLSKAIGFQELNINVGNTDVNAEKLATFILAVSSADKYKRTELLEEGF